MLHYYGKTLHPEFTDLAVVLGPHVRWVEEDYEDLQTHAPEVLHGYRVRLLTVGGVLAGDARGLRIEKIVALEGSGMHGPKAAVALQDLHYGQAGAHFPKVEWYRVHRGYDPVVLKI